MKDKEDEEAEQAAQDDFLLQLDEVEGQLSKHSGPYLVGYAIHTPLQVLPVVVAVGVAAASATAAAAAAMLQCLCKMACSTSTSHCCIITCHTLHMSCLAVAHSCLHQQLSLLYILPLA